jgi:Uncharacterized protein conserved in bacteria (DUF2059)
MLVSFLLALLVTPPALAKGSEKLATQLLEASGINAIYAQGIVAGYKKNAIGTNRPATEIGCFAAKVTPQLTLQPLATGYATEFSDPELHAAISFFESKSGKKYAQYQRTRSSEMSGITSQEREPELSSRDLEVINAFLETRIGKLILSTNSPMSATAKTILQPQLASSHDQCRKTAGGG